MFSIDPSYIYNTQPAHEYTQVNSEKQSDSFAEINVDVSSTFRRLEALVDLIKFAAGPIIWLANKITSTVSSFFSWAKSLVDNNKDKEVTSISTLLPKTEQNSSNESIANRIRVFTPTNKLKKSGEQSYAENALVMLRSCVEAWDTVIDDQKKLEQILNSEKMKNILNNIDKDDIPSSTGKKINELFSEHISDSATLNKFETEVHKKRGQFAPTNLNRSFGVKKGDRRFDFTETSTNIDPSVGAKFLELKSGYSDEVNYIKGHINPETGNIGIRPSAARVEHELQGMSVNCREQVITGKNVDGSTVEIESVFRSGAFTVHDSYYPTETEIDNIEKGSEKVKQRTINKLARKWKMNETSNVEEEALKRIARRRDLCIAQALPKIMASVKKMANEENRNFDYGFLHVEQSFLSDTYGKEREMIRDMAKAMEYVGDKVEVQFSDVEEDLVREVDGKILITLKKPDKFEGELNKPYKVHTAFFTQGVNERQTLGHAFGSGGQSLQDKINIKGLNKLQKYADLSKMDHNKFLVNLGRYFSPTNDRKGKDLQGVKLIADATKVLGGKRGFVCKSGKDRTGSEANDELAYHAARHIGMLEGAKDTRKYGYNKQLRKAIRDNLAGGISWGITGQCTGKPNMYAFPKLTWALLPNNWKVPEKFCGSVPS